MEGRAPYTPNLVERFKQLCCIKQRAKEMNRENAAKKQGSNFGANQSSSSRSIVSSTSSISGSGSCGGSGAGIDETGTGSEICDRHRLFDFSQCIINNKAK